MMYLIFKEFLQVSLNTRDRLSVTPSVEQWQYLFIEAQRQAVGGIMVVGLERLPENQRPPKMLLLQWLGLCQQVEAQNVLMTKTCYSICDRLKTDGLEVCVLKGQTNYRYYPAEMKNRRNCGDIDVWVQAKFDRRCKRYDVSRVIEYVQNHYDMNGLCWLHTSHVEKSGVPVEIHLRASFMSEPCKNRRFQNYFADVDACRTFAEIDGVEIPCLKVDEDVIYQMNHIYRHLIDEGVGLRQVVDYYYLLQSWNKLHTRSKEETMKIISWLGMKRFAGALMYVLREVCGLNELLLLCPASEKDGKFLMNEIMLSGNFGHNDPRMGDVATGGYLKSRISQASRRFKRNMRFFSSYPGEVIWEPIVRVEHFIWKKLKLWRF